MNRRAAFFGWRSKRRRRFSICLMASHDQHAAPLLPRRSSPNRAGSSQKHFHPPAFRQPKLCSGRARRLLLRGAAGGFQYALSPGFLSSNLRSLSSCSTVSIARRLASMTPATAPASSGVNSPAAIAPAIAPSALATSAAVSIAGKSNTTGRPLRTGISRSMQRRMAVGSPPPNSAPAYKAAFDAIYPTLAAKHKIPRYPFFLQGVFDHPRLMLSDGKHPNAAGVRRIVAGSLAIVETNLMGARSRVHASSHRATRTRHLRSWGNPDEEEIKAEIAAPAALKEKRSR